MNRYSPGYVKGYIEASSPCFSVGEYWDTCNYVGTGGSLEADQGRISFLILLCEPLGFSELEFAPRDVHKTHVQKVIASGSLIG